MRILLIRHGQDEPGYRGGWSQRGLSETGLKQARALANALLANWQPVEFLISSDLNRAVETTAEILKIMPLPVRYDQEWRETNNGLLAGMPDAEADRLYPGLFFNSLEIDEPYPQGESPRQNFERITSAFARLCRQIETSELPPNVAVVTHGGVINIIYHLLKNLQWSNRRPAFKTSPTSIHQLSRLDGIWQLTLENEAHHLEGL
jgi:probable phosphoglycerate mutase